MSRTPDPAKPPRVPTTIRLSPAARRLLRERAARCGMREADYLRACLAHAVAVMPDAWAISYHRHTKA